MYCLLETQLLVKEPHSFTISKKKLSLINLVGHGQRRVTSNVFTRPLYFCKHLEALEDPAPGRIFENFTRSSKLFQVWDKTS